MAESQHCRNPVFTDYARKENGVLGTDTTPFFSDDDSAKQHSLLSHVEEAAVEWCHNALMPPPEPSKQRTHSNLSPEQHQPPHPKIIQPRRCSLTSRLLLGNHNKLTAWDERTPSTLSASTNNSYDDSNSSGGGNNANPPDPAEAAAAAAAEWKDSTTSSWQASMPTFIQKKRKAHSGKAAAADLDRNLDLLCQKKCGMMLCYTTEAAFQRMSGGMPGDAVAAAVEQGGESTAEESTFTFPSSSSSDDASAANNNKTKDHLYSESLLANNRAAKKTGTAADLHPSRLNTRFSTLWKKTMKDRRFRALTKEDEDPLQREDLPNIVRGMYEAKPKGDVEVRLMTTEKKNPKKQESTTTTSTSSAATLTRGGTLPHSFRRLMQLRNERQHAKVQQLENERFVTENKVSVVANTKARVQQSQTSAIKDEEAGMEAPRRKTIERKPFDEDSTDVEHVTVKYRNSRRMHPLAVSKRDQKPFDEDSQGLANSPLFGQAEFKIVGKWKEEGEDDSAFYSVADTPYMKRSEVYREKVCGDSGALEQRHDEFSKMKEALAMKSGGKTTHDAPDIICSPESIDSKQPRSLTSLERKLGKGRHRIQEESLCSSFNSSDANSSAFSTAAVVTALRNRDSGKRKAKESTPNFVYDAESEGSIDTHPKADTETFRNGRRPFLSSIKESDWDMPSGSSIYDDSDTADDSSSAAAIHQSFQF